MSKAVIISIRPRWTGLILSGEKTLELRRTRPNLTPPFKCYVYCSMGRKPWVRKDVPGIRQDGHIVAEFVCDKITRLTHVGATGDLRAPVLMAVKGRNFEPAMNFDGGGSCLILSEIERYLDGRDGFLWHISELKIYETPKKLTEFHTWKKCKSCSKNGYESTACIYDENCMVPVAITKAPQSWGYVEELK